MDDGTDWTASALFSPSKAKAQQAQAKDWASVDAWLAKKYSSKRLPAYERNEDTLQALLDLASLNDSADEQQALRERVEKSVLLAASKSKANVEHKMLHALTTSLKDDAENSLDSLAELGVLLGSTDVSTIAFRLHNLTSEDFELREQLMRVDGQQAAVSREQLRLTHLLNDVKSEAFDTSHDLLEQTSEWTRNTKHLKAKVAEYDERLAASRSANTPSSPIEQVARQMAELESQKDKASELQRELAAFQSLPSEGKAAKATLETARDRLRNLIAERDQAFERLVHR